ncbi:MAG: hypothetical protein ACAF41_33405 (plasmid) [Leptolyngbya sp. BL-A-14]
MGKAQRRGQRAYPRGFGNQSHRRDPNSEQVKRAIAELAESQQQMFLEEYQKRGRFAALIDTHRQDVPFLTLKTLQTPKAEPSIFREIAGTPLLKALQNYDPYKEGVLLHVWDVLDPDEYEITIKAQVRRIVFGRVMHSVGLPTGSNPRGKGVIANLQAVLLATSEPISPVLSVDPLEEDKASTTAS